jgi:RNA polymerase sigma factor (TIGR02999 family)
MGQEQSGRITDLLSQFRSGQHEADATLVTLVYDELHRLAARYMRKERRSHSLQPTALVHEAYLRLAGQRSKAWKSRAHFFAVAALLMRQILVDHARRRLSAKRGDGRHRVSLDDAAAHVPRTLILDAAQSEDLIAIDDALTALSATHPRRCRIVEMRFFAGMTTKEIAESLGTSERTVEREWAAAQAWLYARLRPLT